MERRVARIIPRSIFASLIVASGCAPAGVGPSPKENSLGKSAGASPQLPFEGTWYLTGGPHSDGLSRGVRYAVDLASKRVAPCPGSLPQEDEKVLAIAAGRVAVVGNEKDPKDKNHSIVEIDHGGGETSGSMHVANIKVKVGQEVQAGEVLGNPSCDSPPGGKTEGIHLHLYRKKDGKPAPVNGVILSNWTIQDSEGNYQGTMVNGALVRTADERRCDTDTKCGGIRNDITSMRLVERPPTPWPTKTDTPTATPSATSTPKATEAPIVHAFKNGDNVEVHNTSPACMNVRPQPSLAAKETDCIKDGRTATIISGPTTADGYTWWQINNPQGWSVQEFLKASSGKTTISPTPIPPGPIDVSTAAKTTGGFIRTYSQNDFTNIRFFFAPDKQPKYLDDIFVMGTTPPYTPNREQFLPNLTSCAGVPYQYSERAIVAWLSRVTVIFAKDCIKSWEWSATLRKRAGQETKPNPTLTQEEIDRGHREAAQPNIPVTAYFRQMEMALEPVSSTTNKSWYVIRETVEVKKSAN